MEAALISPSGRTTLGPGVMRVGRTPDNQFVVNDPKASSHHAEIRPVGQGYAIVDMGSTNGTFINEQQLDRNVPRLLNAGDKVRIGDTVYTYEVQSAPQIAATAYGSPAQGYDATYQTPYQPTVAAGPPYQDYGSGGQQPYEAPSYGTPAYQAPSYPPPPPQPPLYAAPPSSPPPYPPAASSGIPSYTPAPPSQPRKSRRGLWISVTLIVVVLLALIGGGAFLYINNLPTPAKTLDKFCTALKGGDFPTAYSQLSPKLQSKAPQAVFSALLAKVDGCSYSAPNQTGNSATANLTLTSAGQPKTSTVTLIQDSGNAWKIDDEPGLTVLPKTLDTYCSALKGGDYQTAYSELTSGFQGKLSKTLFTSFLPSVSACTYTISSVSGNNASANLALAYGSGQAETDAATLVQNGDTWKIDSLSAISTPTKTVTAFCSALKNKDYQTSYELLASNLQSGFGSESKFASTLDPIIAGNNGITSCTVSNVQQNGSTAATGTDVIVYGNGKSETDHDTLVNENGIWKISNITT